MTTETQHQRRKLPLSLRLLALAGLLSGASSLHAQGLATLTNLSVSPASSSLSGVVTLTATVSANANPVTIGGVNFFDGKRFLGSAELTGPAGTAVLKTRSFAPGSHSLIARYLGAPNSSEQTGASTSGPASLSVTGFLPSSTTVSAAANAIQPNYDLSAAVTCSSCPAPLTGSVSFADTTAGTSLGEVVLGTSTTSFVTSTTSPLSNAPSSIAFGDFNSDGIPDLARAAGSALEIQLGDPNHIGQFLPATSYSLVAGQNGGVLAIGDLDGNGLADLAVLIGNGSHTVSILLNDATHPGHFLQPFIYDAGSQPYAIALGDLNGDGLLDFALGTSAGVSIWFGDASNRGQFLLKTSYPLASGAPSIALADFNNDGVLDIATPNVILFATDARNGQYQSEPFHSGGSAVASADFNGDGLPDLVVACSGPSCTGDGLVFLNDANQPGQLIQSAVVPGISANSNAANSLATADLNGDGLPDIVVNDSFGNVGLVLGDSGHPGAFLPVLNGNEYNGRSGYQSLALVDLSGIGAPQAAAATGTSEDAQTYLTVFAVSQTASASLLNLTPGVPGLHALSAAYSGNLQLGPSASTQSALIVAPPTPPAPPTTPSAITLSINPQTPSVGSVVALTASVSADGMAVATGQVVFQDGSRVIGTVQIIGVGSSKGSAVLRTNTITTTGTHSLTAAFLGTSSAQPSVSSPMSMNLAGDSQVPSSMTLSVVPNANALGIYNLTAIVTAVTPGGPMGSVTFKNAYTGTQLGSAPLLANDPTFLPQPTLAVGSARGDQNTSSLAAADLNADGVLDLIVGYTDVTSNQQGFQFLAGNPAQPGQFLGAVKYPLSISPTGILIADVNGDGLPDLLMTDTYSSISVSLADASQPGQFLAPVVYSVSSYQVSGNGLLQLADANHDGFLDLALGNTILLYGDPIKPGSFLPAAPANAAGALLLNPPFTPIATAASSPITADLAGDGTSFQVTSNDLSRCPSCAMRCFTCDFPVWANGTVTAVRITPPNPSSAASSYTVGANPGPLVVGDFNGDGIPDIAVLNRAMPGDYVNLPVPSALTISVLFGTRSATASLIGEPLPVQPAQTVGANYSGDQHVQGASMIASYVFPQPITQEPLRTAFGDFDGDGLSDLAVWRPSNGFWYVIPSSKPSAPTYAAWGQLGDIPVPGDYDGDGKTDLAVWRPSSGLWWIIPSSNPSSPIITAWGEYGDIPVPGDYDGDGKVDVAVWRPSTGIWWIILSSNPSAPIAAHWGIPGDIPLVGDFDGDGKADLAIFRPSTGTWYITPSTNPSAPSISTFGVTGDVPVVGDYDGDGKSDLAVWRPSNGTWYITPSGSPSTPIVLGWGVTGDVPLTGHFGADQKLDYVIWRPSTAAWWILPADPSYSYRSEVWGEFGDIPL